ncbi:MAG: hypothetical protein IJA89_07985 [Clostridia bacterium]|nr:hypothetical protein [Clostridia bacterium]
MQDFQSKVQSLLCAIRALEGDKALQQERKLPSDCYFLSEDTVLSYRRDDGDARYPYAYDGLTLWAYASGNVKMEESTFNHFLPVFEAKEPYLAFFAGIKQEDGYFPVSLLGPAKQAFEKGIRRYTVFTPQAAYYFTETPAFLSVVRMLVDDKKLLRLSVYLENTGDTVCETYVSTYINFLNSHATYENLETKWYKRCTANDYGYILHTTEYRGRENCMEHYAAIARSPYNGFIDRTTSHSVYTGSMHNQLNCSTALINGKFGVEKLHTEFTETAVAGDIIPVKLGAKESFVVSYTAAFYDDKEKAETMVATNRETAAIDEYIARKACEDKNKTADERMPIIKFGDMLGQGLNAVAIEYFIQNVLRQVEFCTRSKNYAGTLIGIRDIFQQVEAALTWIPAYSRGKIVEALGYIGDDGRAPRQYSYPPAKGILPQMDLRPYIDQGVWVISTVYTYLCFTGDYSILDEVCGYYKFDGNAVAFSDDKDTVLDHLVRIAEYLLSKLAADTGCLRALYGDWNDALDGLGVSADKSRDFGDGVSVMATLQLYKNLAELCDIFHATGKYTDKIDGYMQRRESIRQGLQKHAIVQNDKGERKIVHGWGDKLRYKIASYCDNDGLSRDGLTSNAYWILCDALVWDKSLKKDIMQAYERLDSKYGLKTFEPYFARDNKDVGRITKLPKGTAENGATYIHATLFGLWSMFEVGESEKAWEQLFKILPLTHKNISTTPFIMSNSYLYNEEKGLDGESMSDWFTGSGCVLIKTLVWEVFGLKPDLHGLTIRPARYFPCDTASISMRVKGCDIQLQYRKTGENKRRFLVNGVERASVYDETAQTEKIYFTDAELAQGELTIEALD